ncbi:class III extradiol dioxygenase subunit B-like domain-containing protein [Actinomadura rugatobispora]|uniref:Class III extradiol dioxygenase subunit B-like domain-containing protein n=1 Tax=Actinomadura rugatobispora TaxID=1994 RepID=A0ABW1AAL5_9ACTN|nr:class III extradiol dioxygenase subunit B-like domain-containing protein [Actinomadura rugatobispora]
MLIYAAVCPHPPLLVPELAGEAAGELDALRAACATAVSRLGEAVASATEIVVVGGGPATRSYGPDAAATLRPYGLVSPGLNGEPENGLADTGERSDPDSGKTLIGAEVLPLSLTIGRWLLRDLLRGLRDGPPHEVTVRFQAVAYDAAPGECLSLGRQLAGPEGRRVALLVMGDGSACLTEKAPGYLDPRAEPYDTAVAGAFERADTAALADLDPGLSHELQAAGRAAWQVLAGAASPRTSAATAPAATASPAAASTAGPARPPAAGGMADRGGAPFDAELLAYEAPYGVGYFVATWDGRPRP